MKKLHLILALSFGLIFVVLGGTGSTLAFRGELQQQATPGLASDYLEYEVYGVDELASELGKHYQDLQIRSVTLPQRPQYHYRFTVRYQEDGKKQTARLFVDPSDASASPVSDHQNSLERWIYELHSSLFLSDRGTQIVGVVGIGTLVLLVIGIALWWPGHTRLRQSFLMPSKVTEGSLLSWLHRTAGIALAPIMIIVAISGAMLVFRQALIFPMESAAKPVPVNGDKPVVSCITNPGLEDYLFVAEQQFPDAFATHIKLPKRATRPVEVTLQHNDEVNSPLGLTRVSLDASCAKVLNYTDGRTLSVAQTLTETVVAVHNGSYFGVLGRLFYGLLGVMPLFFAVSGYSLRRGRKRKTVRRIESKLANQD